MRGTRALCVLAPAGESVCVLNCFQQKRCVVADHGFWMCRMDTASLRRATVLCSFALIASIARLAGAQTPISQAGWTLHYTDSEETLGGSNSAMNAFDGDPSSVWVTEWSLSSPPPPHELQINLGAVYNVGGFRYLPRQDQPYGRISQYEFYVSVDGSTWGAPVASGTFPNSVSEQQVSFGAQPAQYVRLRARTEVSGAAWTVVAELNVLESADGSGSSGSASSGSGSSGSESSDSGSGGWPSSEGPIPKGNWRVIWVDSQESAWPAVNAFDSNPNTVWVTEWRSRSPQPPHEIQIDLGAIYQIHGFRYLTRQDGLPYGRIADYQFFVSMDGTNWGPAAAAGTFANSSAQTEVPVSATAGRYVRFRALSEVGGNPWIVVAELDVLGTATGSTGSSYSGGGGVPSDGASQSKRAIFTPSPDHDTLVRHYVLDFFPSWADPSAANPVLSVDLGKPSVVNGECNVDISAVLQQLWSGNYIGTVTAVGYEGQAQSAPSAEFVIP